MHSRNFWVAFSSLSLSLFAAHGAPTLPQQQCNSQSISTVFQTTTVTAQPSAISNAGNTNKNGNNSKNSGINGNNGSTGNNGQNNLGNNNTSTGNISNNVNNNGGNKANSGSNGANATDPQTSLTLDPKVIATGFAHDGQQVPAPGQVASLTSSNNFINFCLNVTVPITNGRQINTGSCNPAPMGVIPSTANMPSSKFVNPPNLGTLKANTAFTIKMAIKNMATGFFVNANTNYFAAPQFLKQGKIQGHSHVVIEQLSSITQTTVTDPTKFVFFKGLNNAAQGGILTADVPNGLPVGVYRLSSINSAANHQPVLVPVAQHGALDDMIYFIVTANGQPNGGSGNISTTAPPQSASSTSTTTTSTPATFSSSIAATTTVKGGKGSGGGKAASSVDTTLPTTTSTGKAAASSASSVTNSATSASTGNGSSASDSASVAVGKGNANSKLDTASQAGASSTSTDVFGTSSAITTPSANAKAAMPNGTQRS